MPIRLPFAAFLIAWVVSCNTGPQTPSPNASEVSAVAPSVAEMEAESVRLTEWLDARYEEQLEWSPMQKTRLGRKENYDEIDDMSEASEDAWYAWRGETVEVLRESFEYDLLTPEAKTSYDLWIYQYEQAEAGRPFRRRAYLFSQIGGVHTELPQFLITSHVVDNEPDIVAYIARIEGVSRAVGQVLARAKLAADEGVHAPRFAYESVIQQARALITGIPFDSDGPSPLWADANAKIGALAEEEAIDGTRAEELRSAVRTTLLDDFGPVYEALIAWAESELPLTDEIATGVWTLPEGPAYYESRLAAMTTTDSTADEIHELGLAEVDRIRGEMEALKEQLGFDASLQDFFAFVREDPQFVYPTNTQGREAYLEAARSHIEAMKARLPDYFGMLPKADLEVRRVETFRERPGQAQHYRAGTPDGSQPGIFYAHLIDMSSMPIPELESIAYHEGIPGHHMQISIAQELRGLPVFRTQASITAYIEGWGLYAEWLASEMGGYEDPYSDFGRLSGEMWRAIRLVVDTGLHAKGWTDEEAVAYFRGNAPISEGQSRAEVERYIVMPGQATSYKIGMLKIQELRTRTEAALGDRFDIRGFHDTVLGGGALPLTLLEQRVNNWIATQ